MRTWPVIALLVTCLAASTLPAADSPATTGPRPLNVVNWNAQALFSVDGVTARAADLKQFSGDLAPDILILDEVMSLDVVRQVARTPAPTSHRVTAAATARWRSVSSAGSR